MIISSLKSATIDTPIGQMIAIADEQQLYLLEFADMPIIPRELRRFQRNIKASGLDVAGVSKDITEGRTRVIDSIRGELKSYFDGNLYVFKTPICMIGTPFQKLVWEELLRTEYGKTYSYLEQARVLGRAKAVRAVANANGKNQLTIIVPCHRIIRNNMALGGYGGGLDRKKWLIEHERKWLLKGE